MGSASLGVPGLPERRTDMAETLNTYVVFSPEGEPMTEPFENVVDALVYMRLFGKTGARVLLGESILAVKVAATGSRATLKGALGRRRGRAGALDAALEDESDLEEGEP